MRPVQGALQTIIPKTGATAGLNARRGGFQLSSLVGMLKGNNQGKLLAQLANILMLNSASSIGSPSATPPAPTQNIIPAQARPSLQHVAQKPRTLEDVVYSPFASQKTKTNASQKPDPPEPVSRQEIDALIKKAANKHGLDPNLVKAVVATESDFNPACVSSAGAQGLMQLMPETAKDLGVENPFDPAQNIEGGARYLSWMLKRFDGNLNKALSAYNWGPSNVEAGGKLPLETKNYLKKVNGMQRLYAMGFSAKA
ncbi:lytic transglycosylase domain-containing protein [Dethiosulfatarculus sandiegensis]|uniref:lytic transglycosylase domain-containing protein n=1 Tax=Dethiosulfatarculus sandiegensis TaxID=1429043 RepID=UPI000698DA0B|nr:lytic transglycosylase domain-containing protein [Dethiosulfatarculus sandiegensis]